MKSNGRTLQSLFPMHFNMTWHRLDKLTAMFSRYSIFLSSLVVRRRHKRACVDEKRAKIPCACSSWRKKSNTPFDRKQLRWRNLWTMKSSKKSQRPVSSNARSNDRTQSGAEKENRLLFREQWMLMFSKSKIGATNFSQWGAEIRI